MKVRRWTTMHSARVYSTPIFDLHRHRRSHPERSPHNFYVLEAPTWVNIIPLTAKGEVIMVRQFRHGIEGFTLEIPGGMVDPEDTNPRYAARREMIEETGFDSRQIVALGKVHPNPAIQRNYCYLYLARNVRLVGKPQLDGNEEVEVVKIPLSSIAGLIANHKITHALVIVAFSFLQLYNPL